MEFEKVWRKFWKTIWWRRAGSNRRPIDCEPIALPTELRPHVEKPAIINIFKKKESAQPSPSPRFPLYKNLARFLPPALNLAVFKRNPWFTVENCRFLRLALFFATPFYKNLARFSLAVFVKKSLFFRRSFLKKSWFTVENRRFLRFALVFRHAVLQKSRTSLARRFC